MPTTRNEDSIKTFAHAVRKHLRKIELSLPVIVGGIELGEFVHHEGKNFPHAIIKAVTDQSITMLLFRAAIVIYFLSWVLGAESDTDMQAEVYLTAPHGGKLTKRDIAVVLGIVIVFAVMCYVGIDLNDATPQEIIDHRRMFNVAIACFWTINIITWQYLVRLLNGPIQLSYERYREGKSYIELEKLRFVERYITGRWQWWRAPFCLLCLSSPGYGSCVPRPNSYKAPVCQ